MLDSENEIKKGEEMLTVNIYYTGKNGSAKKFIEEMVASGTVEKIKSEKGNRGWKILRPCC